MLITIPESLLELLSLQEGDIQGLVYGRLYDDGDVVQILGLTADAGQCLGIWTKGTAQLVTTPGNNTTLSSVLVQINTEMPQQVRAFVWIKQCWQPAPVSVIRPFADFSARINGLFEVDRLIHKEVAIIGLGTGGAVVASQLVRCGVGKMRLVDFDRLEVHNIARHVCDLRDIGRYKTRAVRDMLLNTSPFVQVQTYEVNILDDEAALREIVIGCDLVIAATDSEVSKMAINRVCWTNGIPAVYGAAYNRAFGGDVFRAIPGAGNACYACFHTAVTDFFGSPPAATDDFSPGYADPDQMADLIAEPGLSMDAGIIALILTRMALLTLLRDAHTSLSDFPTNWVLFGNRAEWIFQKPLESIFTDVPQRLDCPVCNYSAYAAKQLGVTVEEATQLAQQILDALPQTDVVSQLINRRSDAVSDLSMK